MSLLGRGRDLVVTLIPCFRMIDIHMAHWCCVHIFLIEQFDCGIGLMSTCARQTTIIIVVVETIGVACGHSDSIHVVHVMVWIIVVQHDRR